ncbi:MAG: hypothetical protein R6U43_04735, partial [Candidatus Krumholzibacteriales bacterium]
MNGFIKCGVLVLACTISVLLIPEAQSKTFYSGDGWQVAGIKSGNWLLSTYPEIVTNYSGTSVGAIVGALVCGGYRWQEMVEIARSLKWKELISPTLSGLGLVKSKKLGKYIGDLLGEMNFDELEIPFRAVAVDISSGEEVVFSSGSVGTAVRATSAVPGIFE